MIHWKWDDFKVLDCCKKFEHIFSDEIDCTILFSNIPYNGVVNIMKNRIAL